MSQQEIAFAKNWPLRAFTSGVAATGAGFYYLSRHNELRRIMAFKISFDIVFGVAWRSLIAFAVAD